MRRCPLWPATVDALLALVRNRSPDQPVFLNRLGDAITRLGIHWMLRNHVRTASASHPSLLSRPISPHTIRHTTHPGLVQIENGWRNPKEQRLGAIQRGHVREIPTATDNPDAGPVLPCAAAKTAVLVYGKQLGRKLTVCTDKHCPCMTNRQQPKQPH